MIVSALWDVTLCILVKFYRPFRGTCCPHHQEIDRFLRITDAVIDYMTSPHIRQDLHNLRCKKLKSHLVKQVCNAYATYRGMSLSNLTYFLFNPPIFDRRNAFFSHCCIRNWPTSSLILIDILITTIGMFQIPYSINKNYGWILSKIMLDVIIWECYKLGCYNCIHRNILCY
jgi:hypothetical protein